VDRVLTGRAAVPPRPKRPAASDPLGAKGRLVFVASEMATGVMLREEDSLITRARAADLTPPPAKSMDPRTRQVSPVVARTTPAAKGSAAGSAASRAVPPGEQLVERPAPRRYAPIDPVAALVGAGRGLRHGGDGRADPDERLACRRASQVVSGYAGLLSGSDVLPTLGSGAVPAQT